MKYVDEEKMQITFSSIVFNLKSINEKFGNLAIFAERFDLCGETNGRLFYLSGKAESPHLLYEKMRKCFQPLGLTKAEDYFCIIKHPVSDIRVEHPSCVNIAWLGSEITPEGSFLWFTGTAEDAGIIDKSVVNRSEKPQIFNEQHHLTFKILDSMDPKPDFPAGRFMEVPYERFIQFEENCLPIFMPTPVGTFPEEIIPEALEGQIVAFFYHNKLPITTTIFQIVDGNKTNSQKVWIEEKF